jgi:sialate O-acetylesterase
MANYRAMMADWREAFKNPNMPFYLVQIAGVAWHGEGADYWRGVRDAQESLMNEEENVYMTVSYDLSEPDNIHPAKKQPMGERLAAAALANTYGQDVAWRCPTVTDAQKNENSVILLCADASEWHTSDGGEIEGFFFVDRDGKREKISVLANGSELICQIPENSSAEYVEYSKLNYSYTNLLNEYSLPLTPFEIKIK